MAPNHDRTESPRASAMLEELLRRGHRMTGPRQTIVEHLAPRADYFSAQEILDEVQGRGEEVGRATVFRTLDLLVELGMLHRIHAEDGCARYAVCETRHHHHHLLCAVCGAVETLSAPKIEAEILDLAARAQFEVLSHVLELVGRCALCKDKPIPQLREHMAISD